jgi:hypothetical protein
MSDLERRLEYSVLLQRALNLRVALRLGDREWAYLTARHLGAGVAISRAELGALMALLTALERRAADRAARAHRGNS